MADLSSLLQTYIQQPRGFQNVTPGLAGLSQIIGQQALEKQMQERELANQIAMAKAKAEIGTNLENVKLGNKLDLARKFGLIGGFPSNIEEPILSNNSAQPSLEKSSNKGSINSFGSFQNKTQQQSPFLYDPIGGKLIQNPSFLTPEQSRKQESSNLKNIEAEKKQKQESDMVKGSAGEMINTVDKLLDPKYLNYFGWSGDLPSLPGSKKREWLSELNYLSGKQVLNLMTQLRQASKTGATGFGQLSEKELALLRGSANKLSRGLPESAAKEELGRIRGLLIKIVHGSSDKNNEDVSRETFNNQPDGEDFSYMW